MALTPEKLRFAYHEAGHVIVAHELGLYVDSVTIESPFDHAATSFARADTKEYIKALFAGREAHLRFAPCEGEPADEGAGGDIQELDEVAHRLGLSVEDKEALREETRVLIGERWQWVESLVKQLETHPTLNAWGTPSLEDLLATITGKRVTAKTERQPRDEDTSAATTRRAR